MHWAAHSAAVRLVVCSMGWHRWVDTPHILLHILAEVDTLLEQDLDLMDSHLDQGDSQMNILHVGDILVGGRVMNRGVLHSLDIHLVPDIRLVDSRQGAVLADLQGNERVGCAVKGTQLVAAVEKEQGRVYQEQLRQLMKKVEEQVRSRCQQLKLWLELCWVEDESQGSLQEWRMAVYYCLYWNLGRLHQVLQKKEADLLVQDHLVQVHQDILLDMHLDDL